MTIGMMMSIGALITWYSDIRNNPSWFGKSYQVGDVLLVKLEEPLVERPNSWKAFASVEGREGHILLYFQKDSSLPHKLSYGSQLLFKKELQLVTNTGNPGSFDYRRYCLFQEGVTHQVYLRPNQIVILPEKKITWFRSFIFSMQNYVLTAIRTTIKSPKEAGLAEALLIGYQYDVDKTLMQSYSNTGVIHVIAISGLHLGVIYWLLTLLLKPLSIKRRSRYVAPLIIIICLWLFSILAGAQPAILRATVMFTFILISRSLNRNIAVYNSLAGSAFLLLCINPFWLWNVGFQLSYAALLSIVIFSKPLYHTIYVKNKGLDRLWDLAAISIAAQLLTTPFSIYYFHQFPVYFIITNLIAVPLSSLILIGEVLLCATSWLPAVAILIGKVLHVLIWLMNSFVEYMEMLPFSMWQGLSINVIQAVLLVAIIASLGYWLIEKNKAGCWAGITATLLFLLLRSWSFFQANRQHKIIVYNIPKCRAIDIISGRQHVFIGDERIRSNVSLQNFHLKPSRVLHRTEPSNVLSDIPITNHFLQCGSKRIMIAGSFIPADSSSERIPIDLLIITGNPRLYIPEITKTFAIKQVVLDGTASLTKINYWKRDCQLLQIPCYSTNEKGAFIVNY